MESLDIMGSRYIKIVIFSCAILNVLLCTPGTCDIAASLPENVQMIYLKGSNYHVGYQVGTAFPSVIQTAIKEDALLQSTILPYYNTPEGKSAYNMLLSAAEEYFPQYVEEIRGIAVGSTSDFVEVFLTHVATEMYTMKTANEKREGPSESCSDFQMKNEKWLLHVHSEDVPPHVHRKGVIWLADIEASEANNYQTESFVAFAYPGMIPGYAWSVNSDGLVLSGNFIASHTPFSRGMIPLRLMSRSLLKVKSIGDVIDTVTSLPGSAAPFNFMMSQRICSEEVPNCVRMTGVEIYGKSNGNYIDINEVEKENPSYHFNEYLIKERIVDESTSWREKRLGEIQEELDGPLSTLDHLKQVMSDTKYQFPFFRRAVPPDGSFTTNMIFADMELQTLSVYQGKPTESDPDVVFDIRPWSSHSLSLTDVIITPSRENVKDEL